MEDRTRASTLPVVHCAKTVRLGPPPPIPIIQRDDVGNPRRGRNTLGKPTNTTSTKNDDNVTTHTQQLRWRFDSRRRKKIQQQQQQLGYRHCKYITAHPRTIHRRLAFFFRRPSPQLLCINLKLPIVDFFSSFQTDACIFPTLNIPTNSTWTT